VVELFLLTMANEGRGEQNGDRHNDFESAIIEGSRGRQARIGSSVG